MNSSQGGPELKSHKKFNKEQEKRKWENIRSQRFSAAQIAEYKRNPFGGWMNVGSAVVISRAVALAIRQINFPELVHDTQSLFGSTVSNAD